MEALPSRPGSYALLLRLAQPEMLAVGRLGVFTFPAGDYVYLGSARGPGGLRARLGRHLRGGGASRWHIDYLRPAAAALGAWLALSPLPLECAWSQALASLPGASVPVPAFGAGDCASGCPAHLVLFPSTGPWLPAALAAAAGLPPPALRWQPANPAGEALPNRGKMGSDRNSG